MIDIDFDAERDRAERERQMHTVRLRRALRASVALEELMIMVRDIEDQLDEDAIA